MNTKINSLLLSIFLLITANSLAQTEQIDNVQTEEHLVLPGTKFAIIPPDDTFINSPLFTGVQNEALQAAITFTEMPFPMGEVVEMFSKDTPPKDGILVLDKDLVMNGFDAKLMKVHSAGSTFLEEKKYDETPDTEKLTNYVLLYGNDKISFMISASYGYLQDEALSAKFEKSLKSFLYLENIEINPMDQLSFDLDMSTSDLKFASLLLQTGAGFTRDGKFPTELKENAGYMVMIHQIDIEESEREAKAIRGVKKPYEDNITIEQTKEITIDGLSGYEVIGYELTDENEKRLSYSTTLFDEGKYYVLHGTADFDMENYLKEFLKISRSFKRKN